jgi:hypothetical protein
MDWKTELLLKQAAREFSRPYRQRQKKRQREYQEDLEAREEMEASFQAYLDTRDWA